MNCLNKSVFFSSTCNCLRGVKKMSPILNQRHIYFIIDLIWKYSTIQKNVHNQVINCLEWTDRSRHINSHMQWVFVHLVKKRVQPWPSPLRWPFPFSFQMTQRPLLLAFLSNTGVCDLVGDGVLPVYISVLRNQRSLDVYLHNWSKNHGFHCRGWTNNWVFVETLTMNQLGYQTFRLKTFLHQNQLGLK